MEEIAEVYARSLFEVAKEHDELDEVHEQLGEFADVLSKDRQLQVYFFSPYFSSVEKKDGVTKVIEGGNEYFVRFLQLLAEKHRLPVLFRIRRAFDNLWAKEQNLLEVSVTSAVPLDEETVKGIGQKERVSGSGSDLIHEACDYARAHVRPKLPASQRAPVPPT